MYVQNVHKALARLLKDKGFCQCSGRHLMHMFAGIPIPVTSLPLEQSIVSPYTNLQYLSPLTLIFST
jgi:hypothetical protein